MHEVRQYNTKIRLLDELITFECTIKVKIYWRGIKMWHFRFNEMLSIGKWRGWQECVCVCVVLCDIQEIKLPEKLFAFQPANQQTK